MTDLLNTVFLAASAVTAVIAAVGAIFAIVKWILEQNRQSKEIAALRQAHKTDLEALREKEHSDIRMLRNELCVLSYAMLASLDGLKQLNCNGEVTKAHDKLAKHLNQQAHGQQQS